MKILITGSTGMVGRNLVEALGNDSAYALLTPTHRDLDLTDQKATDAYFEANKPDMVFNFASKVGGIQANIDEPVDFLLMNMMISMNVIQAALNTGVKKLLNLGSSCMYPRDREILREEDVLTGQLEPTNEGYAVAKNAAALLCKYIADQYGLAYRTAIPTNLYGPYDHFDLVKSHLLPAVILKLHKAKLNHEKTVNIWGSGEVRRECLYVGDLIDFLVMAIERLEELPAMINVGMGEDHTINEYYQVAAKVIGFEGNFDHDLSKPIGMKKKLLDISRVKAFGWKAKINLKEGLAKTYQYFLNNIHLESE